MEHRSVLCEKTIEFLQIHGEGIYVDGTLGRGGHTMQIASQLTSGHLYAFDKDMQAIQETEERLQLYQDRITVIHADFRQMKRYLKDYDVFAVDGVLLDLGVSSPQFDDPARGFSYRFNARLDMRMDQQESLDAWKIVNTYEQKELTRILSTYGEERFASSIARAIVAQRSIAAINTTFELVDVIKKALPPAVRNEKGHPAKKTFQALRIEVNHELDALREGLVEACALLKKNGRCAVITFHSLEDRIVKTYFKELTSASYVQPKLPIKAAEIEPASYRLITRKPIVADLRELEQNHRAHSAKLRVIERRKEETI